jgi:chromate transport protein ChrA
MKIVFTPDWFLGSDVLIDFFSFLILLTLFIFAYKSYKLSKNKNSFYLGMGFLLIALGEISTILTKLTLFYDTIFIQTVGQMIITYNLVRSTDVLFYTGFFLHKLFTLLGLYTLYITVIKKRPNEFVLVLYFLLISSIFGSLFYYIFHLTTLIILLLIICAYYKIYKKNKLSGTRILISAFVLLALSHSIFLFSTLPLLYVAGQIMQMISYIIFLSLIMVIWKNGKKKKQNKHNIRYVGSYTGKRRKD